MILCESRPEGSYSCPMIQSSRWSAMVRGGPAVWRAMQQVAGQRGCLRQDVLPHGRAAVAHPLQPGSCGAQQLHRDVGLHPSGPFGDLPETLLDVAAVDGARTAATRSSCFRSSTTCKADLPGGDTLRLTGNGPSSYWNCAGKCRADRGWPLGSERIEELHHDPVCRLVSRKCLLMRLQFAVQQRVPHRVDHFDECRKQFLVSTPEIDIAGGNPVSIAGEEVSHWSWVALLVESQEAGSLVLRQPDEVLMRLQPGDIVFGLLNVGTHVGGISNRTDRALPLTVWRRRTSG